MRALPQFRPHRICSMRAMPSLRSVPDPQPKTVPLNACNEKPQPTSMSPKKDDKPSQAEREILDIQLTE